MNEHTSEQEHNGFLDFNQLGERVPYSPRRLRDLVKDGTIPAIRLPGARKLLFDWANVRRALVSHSR